MGNGVQMVMNDVRNNDRCTVDSVKVTDLIWERLKPYIPVELYPKEKCVGLNERLRFLRYDGGEYFKPHFDGTFFKAETQDQPAQTSRLTL